jgi:hypothetical protein
LCCRVRWLSFRRKRETFSLTGQVPFAGLAEFFDEGVVIDSGEDEHAFCAGIFVAPTGGVDDAEVEEFGLVEGRGGGGFRVFDDQEVHVVGAFGEAKNGDFLSAPLDDIAAHEMGVLHCAG